MVKLSNTTGTKPGNYTAYAYFDGEDADFYICGMMGGTAKLQLFWTIGKADAETALTVAGYEDQYAWTGSRIEPKVQVRVPWQDNPLVEGQDYEVYYDNNIDAGTATITVWPDSNYFDGSKTVEFEIVEGTTPEPNPVIRGTWRGSAGKWWYQYNDGSYLKSCWKDIDGARYYFDNEGYAKAGWAIVDGSWYWFDPSSSEMKTGWQSIGGIWYWFAENGTMATGWQQIGDTWYWFSGSGAMLTGWQQSGGTWYYLGGSGAMATGWRQIDNQWYCFAGSGAMQRSCWVGDYYLTSSGAMATNQWVGSYHVGADSRWDNR